MQSYLFILVLNQFVAKLVKKLINLPLHEVYTLLYKFNSSVFIREIGTSGKYHTLEISLERRVKVERYPKS